MRIDKIKIRNFKAIRHLELNRLSDVVIIAGPNGCGKSCIFDAIRLLKSINGGYRQRNEWANFFGEFQINTNNTDELRRLFTDPSIPIEISADFKLSLSERDFIKKNAQALIYRDLWQEHIGGGAMMQRGATGAPAHLSESTTMITETAEKAAKEIRSALKARIFRARLVIQPDLKFDVSPSAVLSFVFGVYDPKNLGIIDYHGPNRAYQRERLGGINVNIEETAERMAQSALYNSQNKYSNIKNELAAAFVRDLFVQQAGGRTVGVPSIMSTLTELFDAFLPGKKFRGPVPGLQGELTFPVKLLGGGEHDIDDLSSGEKELVYGYLRLRNVSPTRSIILLDEPELHLNPRIVVGLPDFYRRHLGIDLGNQLWMATHSDAFLRDAFRSGGISIFHMSPAQATRENENQVVPISVEDEVQRAVLDLVGDIAGYRPGNKVVIFESSESANFDASVTLKLFPEFAKQINPLSGDNKSGVRQIYAALDKAVERMKLPFSVYAIVDRDAGAVAGRQGDARVFTWDVYHIENYLLDETFIAKVIRDSSSYGPAMEEEAVLEGLRSCAEETLSDLISHKLRTYVDEQFRQCLNFGSSPADAKGAGGVKKAVRRATDKVVKKSQGELSNDELEKKRVEFEMELNKCLRDGRWRSEFRGRDILRRFAGRHLRGLPYESFRDQIIARMADAHYEPRGMKEIVEDILAQ